MTKPTGNANLLSIVICGTVVIASMRRNEASANEIIAMAGVFGGMLLTVIGDQRSSKRIRLTGIAIMAVGLLAVILVWLL